MSAKNLAILDDEMALGGEDTSEEEVNQYNNNQDGLTIDFNIPLSDFSIVANEISSAGYHQCVR